MMMSPTVIKVYTLWPLTSYRKGADTTSPGIAPIETARFTSRLLDAGRLVCANCRRTRVLTMCDSRHAGTPVQIRCQ